MENYLLKLDELDTSDLSHLVDVGLIVLEMLSNFEITSKVISQQTLQSLENPSHLSNNLLCHQN